MPKLIDATTSQVLFDRLSIADRFFSRARGLLGRKRLGDDEALIIRPCNSIHTFFMRMPIHVAFVDRDGGVLAVHQSVRPWRLRIGPKRSAYVVEYGMDDRLAVGMKIAITDWPAEGKV